MPLDKIEFWIPSMWPWLTISFFYVSGVMIFELKSILREKKSKLEKYHDDDDDDVCNSIFGYRLVDPKKTQHSNLIKKWRKRDWENVEKTEFLCWHPIYRNANKSITKSDLLRKFIFASFFFLLVSNLLKCPVCTSLLVFLSFFPILSFVWIRDWSLFERYSKKKKNVRCLSGWCNCIYMCDCLQN